MPISSASEIRLSPILIAYAETNDTLATTARRLSSGNRFVYTGEDSASISAAASLQTQTSTLKSALTNGSKATSFLQLAQSGVEQIQDVLTTLVALTEQANASGVTPLQLQTLDAQFQSELARIDTIVDATTFGGVALFDGSFAGASAPTMIAGDAYNDIVELSLPDLTSATLFAATPSLATLTDAGNATTPVTDASDTVDAAVALVDAYESRLMLVDQAVQKRLYGTIRATDSLLKIDETEESRRRDVLSQRQDMSTALIAQTLSFNSGLLDLLAQA